jgi:hypothetical protein
MTSVCTQPDETIIVFIRFYAFTTSDCSEVFLSSYPVMEIHSILTWLISQ